MAAKTFGVNDALSNKLWSRKLYAAVIEALYFGRFFGRGDADGLIQLKSELGKNAGDKVTCGLRVPLTGRGKVGNETLEGSEEGFSTFDDSLFIDELRHGVAVPAGNTIDAQRVPYNLREEAMELLAQWWGRRLDVSMFNQLCGYTTQTDTAYTGLQAPVAPDAQHIFRPAAVANDESLTSSHKFTLSLIDHAVESARTQFDRYGNPIIRPFNVGGEELYVCFIHDYQETDLRLDASTAGNWNDIVSKAMQGGLISKSPFFTGAVGVYNNTIIQVSTNVTQGVHSSTGAAVANARRAVFCGAQAGWVGYGQGFDQTRFKWTEELRDHQKWLAVGATCVWGLKSSRFNSKDFGKIVIPTYAAAHT